MILLFSVMSRNTNNLHNGFINVLVLKIEVVEPNKRHFNLSR